MVNEKESGSPANSDSSPQWMEQLFSGAELVLLDQISETVGFRIAPAPGAKPDDVGFMTDMGRKIIYFNPHTVHSLPVFRRFAFFAHELGHHFPDVVEFQDECGKLKAAAAGLIPDVVKKKDELVENSINVLADVLLESTIPERREIQTGQLIKACFRQNRGLTMVGHEEGSEARMKEFEDSERKVYPWEDQKELPRYCQYMNLCLIAPFFGLPAPDLVSPHVAALFPSLQYIFDHMTDHRVNGAQKTDLFIRYMRDISQLIDQDIEELKRTSRDLLNDMAEFEDELTSNITKVNQITEPGEKKGDTESSAPPSGTPAANKPDPDRIRSAQRAALEGLMSGSGSLMDEEIREKAALLGIRPEIYKLFLELTQQFSAEIEAFTAVLAKFVLQDFRHGLIQNVKDGFMVRPGREVETFLRQRMGEDRPATLLDRKRVLNPRSLQLYFLIDTSGSMAHDIYGTLGFFTIFAVSAMNIHKELRENARLYDLKRAPNHPLEIELTGFDHIPLVAVPLTKDIDLKTLVQGFQHIHDRTILGGGTDDARALRYEYSRMRVGDPRTLKILSMITDGAGQGNAVEPILRQIEEDRDIYFLVNGIGKHCDAVRAFYQSKFRPVHAYHVYADASDTVKIAIPKIIGLMNQWIMRFYGEGKRIKSF